MKTIFKELLQGTSLKCEDAVRLVLEAIEGLGGERQGLTRTEMMGKLRNVIQMGCEAVLRSEYTVSFHEAAWESIKARSCRRNSTLQDLRYFVRKFETVDGWKDKPLRLITGRECRDLLQKLFSHTPSGFRKGRAILHSVFAYGYKHEWCNGNPVDLIDVPDVVEKEIVPLNDDEIQRLYQTVQLPEYREMELSLYLMIYCGLRPTEVQRLKPEDIDWEAGCVIVRPSVSKTGGGRTIPLRELRRLKSGRLTIPRDWQRRWKALRKAAGFTSWMPDICRHTFATWHASRFQNLPQLQLEMGHRDCNLLRSRYVNGAYVRRQVAQVSDEKKSPRGRVVQRLSPKRKRHVRCGGVSAKETERV